MHLSHIPQYTIHNRNVHITVVNGVLWDIGQVHCRICEIGPICGREDGSNVQDHIDNDWLLWH